jgi:hypothetical protein
VTDWSTISSLATGAGTLVLAVATFASVRSANRSAKVAERGLHKQQMAMEEQRRPLLAPSHLEDPEQKIMFQDLHWVHASGGGAVAEHTDGNVYLAMSLRNIGAGIAVLQAWSARCGLSLTQQDHRSTELFRSLTRDLYISPGDIGFWQGALRDETEDLHHEIADAICNRDPITIELLYTDQAGAQPTITRFTLTPVGGERSTDEQWLTAVNRHWYINHTGPR